MIQQLVHAVYRGRVPESVRAVFQRIFSHSRGNNGMKTITSSLLGGLLAAAVIPAADAAVENLQFQSGAAGLCQGALPVMDSNLRKRPLGVANEGETPAFVSCAFTTLMDQGGGGGVAQESAVRYFGMFLSSYVAEPQTVSCTGVIGYEGSPSLQYVSLDVDVSSETPDTNYLYFYPEDADPGQEHFHQLVSMSCRLPPGTGINDTYVGIRLDDAE